MLTLMTQHNPDGEIIFAFIIMAIILVPGLLIIACSRFMEGGETTRTSEDTSPTDNLT